MKKVDTLAGREDLSPEQFFSLYYSDSGIDKKLVEELLEHIAIELSIASAKLRPQDRFAVELAARTGDDWDSGYGILINELSHLARRRGKKIENKIATIDDYIKMMALVY